MSGLFQKKKIIGYNLEMSNYEYIYGTNPKQMFSSLICF